MLKQLLLLARPGRGKQFIFVTLIMLASTISELAMLGFLGLFITSILNPDGIADNEFFQFLDQLLSINITQNSLTYIITFLGILVIFAAVFKSLVRILSIYAMSRYSEAVAGDVVYDVIHNLLHANYEKVLLLNRSEIIQNIEWRMHIRAYLLSIIFVIGEISVSALIITGLIITNPLPSMVLLVLLGLFAVWVFTFLKRIIDVKSQQVTQLAGNIFTELRHYINGFKDLLISCSEENILREIKTKFTVFSRISGTQIFFSQLPAIIVEALGFIVLAGLSIVLLNTELFSITDLITLLTVFAVALWRVIPGMVRSMNRFGQIQVSRPYIQRIITTINELGKYPHEWQSTGKNISKIHTLSFSNVTYQYQTRPDAALKNITFSAKRGEKIGIIGSSGSGKSTLVDMLIGLISPRNGEVRVNDTSLMQVNRDNWLNQIGYVSQSPFFCDSSIAENIIFGHNGANANEKHLRHVCDLASMNYINDLPNGLHTRIGEKGVQLSGGQLQRIAIARTLYRNPVLIIFDEATSALDNSTEKSIMNTIYSIQGITMFIVAHRLSTVKRCDNILWIENGELQDYGPPDVVIPRYELYTAQHTPQYEPPLVYEREM